MKQSYSVARNWATKNFLSLMEQAPDQKHAENIGKYFAAGLTINGRFDATKFDARLCNIPRDKESFAAMWQVSLEVHQAYGWNEKAASHLMINSGKQWQKNLVHLHVGEAALVQSAYFKSITDDLVLPVFFKELHSIFRDREKDLPQLFNQSQYLDFVSQKLRPAIVESVTESLSPFKLLGLANRCLRNVPVMNAAKSGTAKALQESKKDRRSEWHAIIEDQKIGGCEFRVLTNQYELSKEAAEVINCIAGFGNACRSGASHVIAGKDSQGKRFSIDMRDYGGKFEACPDEKEKRFFSDEINHAISELESAMNNGRIAVNKKRGAIAEWRNIEDYLGFNIEKESQEIRQKYQHYRLVPRSDLADQTSVRSCIKKTLDEEIRLYLPPKTSFEIFSGMVGNLMGRGSRSDGKDL